MEIAAVMETADFAEWVKDGGQIQLNIDKPSAIALIGQLQLAMRHPHNNGSGRQVVETLVRQMIDELDPTGGDVYKFLMLGFDPAYDVPAVDVEG